MKIFDTPPWVDKCHLFVRLPLGTPSKNKYNKLGGGVSWVKMLLCIKLCLTHWGRKVFRIFAFFLIFISQKTHLNFQNPTGLQRDKTSKLIILCLKNIRDS